MSLLFCAVKLHTSRWLYSLTYEQGAISMIQRRKYDMIVNITEYIKQKGAYLSQSYDKRPYTHRKIQKVSWHHNKRHQKLRLHNDCGPT